MSTAPYRLSEGLYLEKSGTMLTWSQSLQQLAGLGGRPVPGQGKPKQVVWDSEMVIGGLQVAVQAMAHGSGIYYLTPKGRSYDSAHQEYAALLDELKERLGAPHRSRETKGDPWVRWHWEDICLNLAISDRFVDYVVLSVSKGVFDSP